VAHRGARGDGSWFIAKKYRRKTLKLTLAVTYRAQAALQTFSLHPRGDRTRREKSGRPYQSQTRPRCRRDFVESPTDPERRLDLREETDEEIRNSRGRAISPYLR
jgi:hypothetical protein